jgi:hypothetical protein
MASLPTMCISGKSWRVFSVSMSSWEPTGQQAVLNAVLRIHNILVWIRIWIRGSMPQTNRSGCGSGSFSFVIDLQDANKKLFFLKAFCILLFEGTYTSFSQVKKSRRSHKKTEEIRVFLTIFA